MRRFISLCPLVSLLLIVRNFGAAAPGHANRSETILPGTLDAQNPSQTAPPTSLPTITIVSYVTLVSNGRTSITESLSLIVAPNPFDRCFDPNSYDCINKNLPDDWEWDFSDFYNPYVPAGEYLPPYSGFPTLASTLDPNLLSSCGDKWTSTFSQWLATAETESQFSKAVSAYYSVSDPVFLDWRDFGPQTLVPYTASPPCCSACTLSFGDVQVYDWPATLRPPPFSTLVNAQNSTFVYPSLYVAFRTLAGTDLCGYVGAPITSVTTLAFDRSDLSTMNSYWFTQEEYSTWWAKGPDFSFTALQSVIGTDCSNITTTLWGQSELLTFDITSMEPVTATSFETMINGTRTTVDKTIIWAPVSVTYNPCYPYLSIPSKIFTMSPQWSNCVKFMTGLKDPCIYMSTGPGFSAVTPPAYNGLPKPTPHELPSPARASAAPVFQQSTASKTAPPGQTPTALPAEEPTCSVQPPAPLIPGGSSIVIDGSTKSVDQATKGEILQQISAPTYIIDGQTLVAGGTAITSSGTVLSLEPDGESVVIGGSTMVNISQLTGASENYDGLRSTRATSSGGAAQGATHNSGQEKMKLNCQGVWLGVLFGFIVFRDFG
ncbi:hypothetical protein V8E51_008528 [Hyaloscypha variabilis]